MRLRKGQWVRVGFLDHVEGGEGGAMPFVVYGELSAITPISICVDGWCHQDPKMPHDRNETRWTIIRSCITEITHLEARE